MEIYRPIPDWTPSTPYVSGPDFDLLVTAYPVVAIHFWAPWNGVDPPMDRNIQAIAESFANRVHFTSCNIDLPENQELCKRVSLANIPTVAVFVHGQLRRMIVGLRQHEQLSLEIEASLHDVGLRVTGRSNPPHSPAANLPE